MGRNFMVYVKEKVKLWDKRHDAWMAKKEEEMANKASGLRMIRSIVQKFDQENRTTKMVTIRHKWQKHVTKVTSFNTGMEFLNKIMRGWILSALKTAFMNMRSKHKVFQGKIKLEKKKKLATEEMAKMTEIVKKQVQAKIEASEQKMKDKDRMVSSMEQEMALIADENEMLRRRIKKNLEFENEVQELEGPSARRRRGGDSGAATDSKERRK